MGRGKNAYFAAILLRQYSLLIKKKKEKKRTIIIMKELSRIYEEYMKEI